MENRNKIINLDGSTSTMRLDLVMYVAMVLCFTIGASIGLSLKSHDPSQRANGFLTLAGGIIITFTKEMCYNAIIQN